MAQLAETGVIGFIAVQHKRKNAMLAGLMQKFTRESCLHVWGAKTESPVHDPLNPAMRTATRVEQTCRFCHRRIVRFYT